MNKFEINFLLFKNYSLVKVLKLLTVFLYTAYADDSVFLHKDLALVKKLLDILSYYLKLLE